MEHDRASCSIPGGGWLCPVTQVSATKDSRHSSRRSSRLSDPHAALRDRLQVFSKCFRSLARPSACGICRPLRDSTGRRLSESNGGTSDWRTRRDTGPQCPAQCCAAESVSSKTGSLLRDVIGRCQRVSEQAFPLLSAQVRLLRSAKKGPQTTSRIDVSSIGLRPGGVSLPRQATSFLEAPPGARDLLGDK